MRKFLLAFFVLTLTLGGVSTTAYATDCTKENLGDKFGDWFGTLGKKEKRKARILASHKANRLAACSEKQAQEAAEAAKKSSGNIKS